VVCLCLQAWTTLLCLYPFRHKKKFSRNDHHIGDFKIIPLIKDGLGFNNFWDRDKKIPKQNALHCVLTSVLSYTRTYIYMLLYNKQNSIANSPSLPETTLDPSRSQLIPFSITLNKNHDNPNYQATPNKQW
jgi:hypothetical protein